MDCGSLSRIHSRFRMKGSSVGTGLMSTNPQSVHSTTLKVPDWPRNLSRAENNTVPDGPLQGGQIRGSGTGGSLCGALSCCTVNEVEIALGRADTEVWR